MDIRHLDAAAIADDDVMRAWYDVSRRAELHGREQMPFWSLQEFLGAFRSPDKGERHEMYAAYDGDRMVGQVVVWFPLADNTDKAYINVAVDVPYRRRGIGRALMAQAEAASRRAGRSVLLTSTQVPFEERRAHRHERFAEACGYTWSIDEILRHLVLPVADDEIQGWIDAAAPKHENYTIETHVGGVPADLVDGLCLLVGQLAVDAPSGAVDFEQEVIDAERYAEMMAGVQAMGRVTYETIALTPDREVVAQSTLAVSTVDDPVVFQWGTFVHREHRGHSLGLATKAVNLRAVQAARDDVTLVTTQNAETNDYMVAINERMGFVPVECSAELVKRL
jgi:GNAT superfamily N-acetyltransferase